MVGHALLHSPVLCILFSYFRRSRSFLLASPLEIKQRKLLCYWFVLVMLSMSLCTLLSYIHIIFLLVLKLCPVSAVSNSPDMSICYVVNKNSLLWCLTFTRFLKRKKLHFLNLWRAIYTTQHTLSLTELVALAILILTSRWTLDAI